MNKSKFQTMLKPLLTAALVAATVGTAVAAENRAGYVRDARDVVVKSGTGLCWRTSYWTPAMAIKECDGDLSARTMRTATMSLSSDGLFEFGKAVLQPKGTAALDGLVAKLKGAKIKSINVAGHTDRIGKAEGNQVLSTKRANAVKAYLVSKGISGSVIHATGKGSTQPKTMAIQCTGAVSPQVIECLSPDRRVDLDVEYAN